MTLYDRGFADAIARARPDMHLVYHWRYRLGYVTGRRARENRDEAMRNAIREKAA